MIPQKKLEAVSAANAGSSLSNSLRVLAELAPTLREAGIFVKVSSDPEPDRLLSRKDIAAKYQIHTETVKRRERAGELKFVQVGRQKRYRQSDVERAFGETA